jgi:hypothetical protein
MMSLVYIFWMFVIIFSIIGALRGWAKEILVSFSVILALALTHVIRKYVPLAASLNETDLSLFWMNMIILGVMVFFGYQTVLSIPRFASRATRERLQDTLFGGFLGAINGYLIAGSVFYYIVIADYPYEVIIAKPTDPTLIETINQMMLYMPPAVLGEPLIYFAVMLAFVFVLIVYI